MEEEGPGLALALPGIPASLWMSVDQEDWDRPSPRYYVALIFDDSALCERQDTASESVGQCSLLAVETAQLDRYSGLKVTRNTVFASYLMPLNLK